MKLGRFAERMFGWAGKKGALAVVAGEWRVRMCS